MEFERAEHIASLPRKRMGAGALFVDEFGRALLVEPAYKDYWELPGGVVEAGESPGAAAVREIGEELGLSVPLGRLLVVDWVPPGLYPDDGLMLIFDGGGLGAAHTAAIVLQTDELRSWAWCDETDAAERLPDVMARRVAAALKARAGGGTAYLEDGFAMA
ncbi:NUDIX domain-containing protein [Nocardia sp. NPDC052566]|uniref:NUDIX domain-containing protein n=1 Tax=Nocardia sp. NPDC052566 TaxID=3364330 RepID=UPI0037C70585